ncbi:hypothetical protein EW026_g1061 [Hermanssonia centrifuga]|uniref:Uncharacterized protein n=1 Tax=Hermanssonia centrifuga TaxID=98765 RepID=A0A4S4KSV1_9APHY|nr:hypothetical protein EW026_g1061 [Hermanssonia centrifuga]
MNSIHGTRKERGFDPRFAPLPLNATATMAQMNFSTFLIRIADALENNKGLELAYLLSPREAHSKSVVKEFRNPTKQSLSYYEGSMESPWDEIAIQYVLVVSHCGKDRAIEAFKEHCSLVKYFANNSGWTLPALFSILRDLRDLACDADLQAQQNGQGGTANMEEAARIISKGFSNCVTDRQSPYGESRKWGVYYIVGLILKCYFRVCGTYIIGKEYTTRHRRKPGYSAAIGVPTISPSEDLHFPSAQNNADFAKVTYRYYIGMLGFLSEDYVKSEQELTLAFYNCHTDARRNQE